MKRLTELQTTILGIIETKTANLPLVRHVEIVKELAHLARVEYLTNQEVRDMIQAIAGLKEGGFIEQVEESYRLTPISEQ
jgi:hypothetical protein